MVNYEYFYDGTPYSLDPNSGTFFTGFRVPAGQLGATTSVQTANQVREVTNLLNQGIKAVEVSTISPEVFEMIPTQHLKEIHRLNKLTGSEVSLHAPVIDPSGFTQQGWDEVNRETAERQFKEIIERGHELSPDTNMPITIHASAIPGTEFIPLVDKETGEVKEVPQRMIAVNRESGEFIPLVREERFYPGNIEKEGEGFKGKLYEVEGKDGELAIANRSYWDQKLSQLVFYKERGDELLTKFYPLYAGEKKELFTPEQQNAASVATSNAMIYLDNTYQTVNSLFNQAFKFADKDGQQALASAAEDFKKELSRAQGKGQDGRMNPSYFSNALQGLITSMQDITEKHTPQIYTPAEKFVKEQASKTLGNVAFSGYNKFGDKAPIVSIENPPYGSAIARAQDMKDLIEMSRQKFVEKAQSEGVSKSEAEDAAKKLIGATWDTSHNSMMRKQGFGKEKLVEEAKTIAPFVKHVHMNDNLGTTHTDLPAGMGDIPFKDVMEALGKQGEKAKKIFEGGNFFQHFQTSPHPYVLEAMGSPLYSMMNKPYWNQAQGTQGNYFAFPSAFFPEQHFSLYGGGFSGLPQELGGQIQGRQSRVSGTPMA